ncbi:hypothetical protein LX32DRAFT_212246 [Colletotrichum zoysiae]|uniref:Uncharacterized protein n=1 Tax=Colletotrichum zoysiae TaxID=1216348 RepID=A0AAD9LU50_9PEZI|nr:hypothetical protein LX32DRAFT_212246 [Colletotrichum zoysiae]
MARLASQNFNSTHSRLEATCRNIEAKDSVTKARVLPLCLLFTLLTYGYLPRRQPSLFAPTDVALGPLGDQVKYLPRYDCYVCKHIRYPGNQQRRSPCRSRNDRRRSWVAVEAALFFALVWILSKNILQGLETNRRCTRPLRTRREGDDGTDRYMVPT